MVRSLADRTFQLRFHVTLFREMVFALAEEATEEVDAATPENFQNRTCIWRALCRVFYEMQSGSAESPLEIDDLVSALGVDNLFTQYEKVWAGLSATVDSDNDSDNMEWYPGTISKVNAESGRVEYTVKWDDCDKARDRR